MNTYVHTMQESKIVLDTNCLIASLSKRGKYYTVWKGLQEGKYILCVSNEILDEYQEIIERKTNAYIAENVIQFLINCKFVEYHEPSFRFCLIEQDPDDNKFVDCAISSNASFIVSNDRHFNILKDINFPHVNVIHLIDFLSFLQVDRYSSEK